MVHIFVAEDSKLIRRVIKTIIEEHAFEVITSDDNGKIIDKFRQNNQETLFLDITLPDKKGINAIYDLIKSIPEARVELFRSELIQHLKDGAAATGGAKDIQAGTKGTQQAVLNKTEFAAIIDAGLGLAVNSLAEILKKDLTFTVLQIEILNLAGILNYVPRTCLGVFYKINDIDGASIMFPLKDIFSVFGLLQIDFTISDNTIQDIINELGNIFMKSILKVMNEMLQETFTLSDPNPATGDNLEEHFAKAAGQQNNFVLTKFNFKGDNKSIEVFMVVSLGKGESYP